MLAPQQIQGGGPWYAETRITDDLIVEPWNSFSSLALIFPAVYFLWKIRKEPMQFKFLLLCIPLLFANGLGSTLFHGLRSSRLFLTMDYMPAFFLTLIITAYLWIKVLPKWWMGIGMMGIVFLIRRGAFEIFAGQFSINASYAIGGLAFLIPLVLLIRRSEGKLMKQIIFAVISFFLAIYFRGADKDFVDIIPFGTHFLWHIFSGLGAFFIADFLYKFRVHELKLKETA